MHIHSFHYIFFFFFNDTATTEIYTLSLHDALPIDSEPEDQYNQYIALSSRCMHLGCPVRSEEHTSELQSLRHLVCRLLREKKKGDRPHSRPVPGYPWLLHPKPCRRKSESSLLPGTF